MKVYGYTMDGSTIWFDNQNERDDYLREEFNVMDKEYPEDEKPVACESAMTKKEFDRLPEFEGW